MVLVLVGLGAGLVAPSLMVPRPEPQAAFATLVRKAQSAAMRRSETLYLQITPTGAWRLDGGASNDDGAVATGVVDGWNGPAGTLAISSLGSCGFTVDSETGAGPLVDPLTCEVR